MRDVVTNPMPHDLGYCPCCGFRLQSNWTFCPHCGGTIDADGEAVVCHCGRRFADGDHWCAKCREKRGPAVHPRVSPRA